MDKCETCVFYLYDEEYDDYVCDMDLDEDEMVRFLASDTESCPFWRPHRRPRHSRATRPEPRLRHRPVPKRDSCQCCR